jgi:hypothetical protein
MPSLYTEITINAPRSVVWHALIRKEEWLMWNTFLFDHSPQQAFQQGRKVGLSLRRLPGEGEIEFEALVTLVQLDVCLQWKTQAPGIQTRHVFELVDVGMNRTKYIHREKISGMLASFVLPFIRQEESQGIRRMAYEIKHYAESLSR